MSENVKQLQIYLTEKGYNPGPIDGLYGSMTERAWRNHCLASGPKQRRAAVEAGFPRDRVASILNHYGDPLDISSKLVKVRFPWRAHLYDARGAVMVHAGVHPLLAVSLSNVFESIWDLSHHRQELIDDWGMSRYFGCYNNRPKRGGTTPSLHAYAAALDFDASRNAFHTSRSHAWMPEQVIDVWEKYGWKSGGRAWNKDFMHFQATQ